MRNRILILTIAAMFITVACTGAAAPTSPLPSSDPGAPPTSPAPAPAPTGSTEPDLTRLRVSTFGWQTDFTRATVDLAEFLGGGPGKDGIPAIDEPRFDTFGGAREWLQDRSPVIALEVGGQARAYPLAILMWHEIVNDTLGGVPIVVTFCPLCNTALVFEREIDGVVYDFGTTGNLRFSDLVMYDRQTESWWQQATGQAVVGELAGTPLTFLPAQIISLGDFEATYPTGDVLNRQTGFNRGYGRNPYVGYDTVDQNPFLFDGVIDGRLPPMERVVTVADGASAIGFPFSELRKVGVVSTALDGESIVVFWMPGTASALSSGQIDDGTDAGATGVYRPVADGRELTFRRTDDAEDAPIVDVETDSTWSITGRATSGPLAGTQLEPIVHGNHFWFAWAAFSPDTTIWTVP